MTTAAVKWSRSDDIIFEGGLVKFPDGTANRWEMIAGLLAGKTAMDVMVHYEVLVFDVDQIEAGFIELPSYPELTDEAGPSSGMQPPPPPAAASAEGRKRKRKKGKPWTVEEHMLFLKGLEIFGQSDWRSISRYLVTTRQPSQVASHAQKYIKRLKSDTKTRKRSSIHDITIPSASITTTHVENTSMNYYANNSSSPSVGVSNDTTSGSENFDMSNDAASVGVNHCGVGEDYYMNIDTTSVGVNPYVNNDATGVDENAAVMNFYANNDCLSVGNDTTSVGVVGVNPYVHNDATGVGFDFHMNFDDTTSFGVSSYMNNNNDTSSVGGDLNMDELWGFIEDDFGNASLECQFLPESSNTTNTNPTSVSAPSSVGGDLNMDELWGFIEDDFGNASLDFQFLSESSNTTNTNPTSVSAPADVNANANAAPDDVNANANADADADAIVQMLEWPSDPWMDSVFYV